MNKLICIAAVAACFASTSAYAEPIKLTEGTPLRIRIEDKLSSGTSADGDTFVISLVEPIEMAAGTIPAGFHGKGEVVLAKKKGMMGQGGQLNIRFNYLRIGDARVRLRGQKGGEGNGAMTSTIALTILFGPLGLLKHGNDLVINKGQELTAYVDDDVLIPDPIPAPPEAD